MNAKSFSITLSVLLFLSAACKKTGTQGTIGLTTATIDLGAAQQTIRGFGGSSAWQGALTDAEMNTLYGNADSSQLGLSVLRIRIAPADTADWTLELQNAQKAIARGAIVMATPWSPPAAMKSNNSTLNGGQLNTSSYAEYSNYLSGFAGYMAANGAPLYAISIQNEPDYSATYESCTWTPAEVLNFVKNYAPAISSTKLMAAESLQFNHAYTDPVLDDSVAASHLSIVAGHIYGAGGIAPYQLSVSAGKEVWMTEHEDLDTTWAGAMATAKEISDCLAIANFNVYNFWWLVKSWGLIDASGNPTKRGFVMAQFAKYIRPGYQRVSAPYSPVNNVYISAYKSGNSVVLVAINTSATFVSQSFSITGGTIPASFSPHITSGTLNISTGKDIAVSAGACSYSLPAQSITTFVSN